jgi:hypothetical protein
VRLFTGSIECSRAIDTEMTRTNPYDSALQRHTRCGDIAPVEHAYFVNTSETIRVDPIYLRDVQQSGIFSQSHSAGEHGGIVQPGVTARKGTYNVSVRRTIYQSLCRPVFDR